MSGAYGRLASVGNTSPVTMAGHPVTMGGYPTSPVSMGGYPTSPVTMGGYPTSPVSKGGYPTSPVTMGGYHTSPVSKGGYPASPVTMGGYPTSLVTKGLVAPPQGLPTPVVETSGGRPGKCGLCTQMTTDIRMLKCGHTFCVTCLGRQIRDLEIECPASPKCEQMTLVWPGQEVSDLPKPLRAKPPPLTKTMSLSVNGWAAVALVEEENWLLVRTARKDAPLCIYSYQGNEIQRLGEKQIRHSDTNNSQVVMDTLRGYILTTAKSKLVVFDAVGHFIAEITHPTFRCLTGVAYHANADMYVLTDTSNNCVYYLDPISHQVVNTFGSYGKKDGQFNWPISACCDKSGRSPLVAISDYRNCCLKMYDPSGMFVSKYDMSELTKQKGVYGVTMDTKGRILVCCHGNQPVVRVWPESDPGVPDMEEIMAAKATGNSRPYTIDTSRKGALALTTDISMTTKQVVLYKGYQ